MFRCRKFYSDKLGVFFNESEPIIWQQVVWTAVLYWLVDASHTRFLITIFYQRLIRIKKIDFGSDFAVNSIKVGSLRKFHLCKAKKPANKDSSVYVSEGFPKPEIAKKWLGHRRTKTEEKVDYVGYMAERDVHLIPEF